MEFLLGMWEAYANETTMTPAELLDLLTEDEVTCMRETFGLTKEQFDAVVKTAYREAARAWGWCLAASGKSSTFACFHPSPRRGSAA